MLQGEFRGRAHDVLGAAHRPRTGRLLLETGKRRLIRLLGEAFGVGGDREAGAESRLRLQHPGLFGVHGDRVKGHAAPVHAPLVHMRAIELRSDARFEDALVLGSGNALSVVEDGEQTFVAGLLSGEEDAAGAGIAGVAQKLDDHVLARADVLGGLASFGLGGPEADEAVSEVILDP